MNIGYLRSKVCSQPNAKFLEISSESSADGSAVEKKINSLLNGPTLRLDEVPRTLILNGGKVSGFLVFPIMMIRVCTVTGAVVLPPGPGEQGGRCRGKPEPQAEPRA